MKYLVIIPARGGSKGLVNKNIMPLHGIPLIHYTLKAAREVFEDCDICVTTDSLAIIEVVEQIGLKVPFVRPDELATDQAGTEDVLRHALHFYEQQGKVYDYIVLLQPTSPLRNGLHIKEALKLISEKTEMIVSVKETDANPYYVLFEEDGYGILEKSKKALFTRRQDCPVVYQLNGAIYLIKIDVFKAKSLAELAKEKYLMDKWVSVDIDDLMDFKIAELIIKELNGKN
mgnify:CR=1 FL=1